MLHMLPDLGSPDTELSSGSVCVLYWFLYPSMIVVPVFQEYFSLLTSSSFSVNHLKQRNNISLNAYKINNSIGSACCG